MGKLKYILLISVLIASVVFSVGKYYYFINVWKYQGDPVVFDIRPGESFSSINNRLAKQRLIAKPKVFHRYAQLKGLMSKFKAGRYEIKPNSNMLDILNIFVGGNSITISVTIPEGKNIYEIAEILEKKSITSKQKFLVWAKNPSFAKLLNIPGNTVEGYLFPETYRFSPQSDPKVIIKVMVHLFNKKTKHLDFLSNSLALDKRQVVILASIIEKETGAASERGTVAGVFANRLKRKMRLQSDPTTIYGIFETFNGNLKRRHLRQKTPYNTYKINGLPLGPISSPGLKSLEAALSPSKHNYLYFVSRNDGTHIFSKSYKEHLKAVNKYQKDRRNRQGKSWRNLKKSQNR